jgi:hypothetical protein
MGFFQLINGEETKTTGGYVQYTRGEDFMSSGNRKYVAVRMDSHNRQYSVGIG